MSLSEGFYAMLIATGAGIIGAMLTILYKSKCTRVKCCGLIDIERDVAGEEKYDEEQLHTIQRDNPTANTLPV
jgi:hypothetical protein